MVAEIADAVFKIHRSETGIDGIQLDGLTERRAGLGLVIFGEDQGNGGPQRSTGADGVTIGG